MLQTFETPNPVQLRLELSRGRVRVEASDRVSTSIELHPVHMDDMEARAIIDGTEIRQDGDRLLVISPRHERLFSWRNGSVEAVVRLPEGSRIEVRTDSASVETLGVLGGIVVRSGSGSVDVAEAEDLDVTVGSGAIAARKVARDLELKTGSGRIEVADVGGNAKVTTGSGAISIGKIGGEARLSAASGALRVREAGPSLDAQTASGHITVERAGQGRVRARSASGGVDLGIAAGVAAWLDVRTLSGRVESELESSGPPSDGAPSVEVSVNTVSGRVRLHRVAAIGSSVPATT